MNIIEKHKSIWHAGSENDWFEFLKATFPTLRIAKADGGVRIYCPFHGDQSKPVEGSKYSMLLTPKKGIAYCFNPSCKVSFTNPIKFLKDLSSSLGLEMSTLSILEKLSNAFGENLKLNKTQHKEIEKYEIEQRAKQYIWSVCHKEASTNAEEYPFTINYLKSRGIDPDNIINLDIGILPSIKKLKHRDKKVDNAISAILKKESDPKYIGSIIFPYHIDSYEIGSLKLRIPPNSPHFGNTDKITFYVGENKGPRGLFGTRMNLALKTSEDERAKRTYVVEGEFCALSYMQGRLINTDSSNIVATGGSVESDFDIERVSRVFQTSEVIIVGDNDEGGYGYNDLVLSNTSIPCSYIKWEGKLSPYKDIDEAILRNNFLEISSLLRDNLGTKIEFYAGMVSDFYKKEAHSIYREKYIKKMRDRFPSRMEWKDFIDHISKKLGEDLSGFCKDTIRSADDDEFIEAICEALLEDYIVMGKKIKTNSDLYLWNRQEKAQRILNLSRKSIYESQLQSDLGPFYEWCDLNIGIPEEIRFIPSKGDLAVQRSRTEQNRMLSDYISVALNKLATDAVDLEHSNVLYEGIHCIKDGEDHTLLIANGLDFYVAPLGESDITFTKVEAPVFKGRLIESKPVRWSHISSISDIERGRSVNVARTYDTIRDIIATGWRFMDDSEYDYVAAFLMYLPFSSVLTRKTYTFFHAEASSGKTTMLSGTFTGVKFGDLKLSEMCEDFDVETSAAGFKSRMSGLGLVPCIDEFEIKGGKDDVERTRAVKKMLGTLRGAMYEGSTSVQGVPGGGAYRTLSISCPAVIGAINDVPGRAELSRLIKINMKPGATNIAPSTSVRSKYSYEELAQLRKDITVYSFSRINEIRDTAKRIEGEIIKLKEFDHVPQRYREALIPVMVVLEMAGKDYMNWFKSFILAKSTHIDQINESKECDLLATAITENLFDITFPGEDTLNRGINLNKILANPNLRNKLNQSTVGVYYLPENKQILIQWNVAYQRLLSKDPRFSGISSPSALANMIKAYKYYVGDGSLLSKKYLRRLLGVRITPTNSNLSIIDISKWINETERDLLEEADAHKEIQFSVMDL